MQPAKIDLTIYQGSTFLKEFQWKVGSPPTPIDLTGYKAKMDIREKISSPSPIITLSTENGRVILKDPTNGIFTLEISAADTSHLKFKSAVYDLEFISPTGFVQRLIEGNVYLSPEVTR
ncbi:MAG: hypothetical protein ACPLYF_01295 [Fervidobacterium sp.]|jgi:hypothetical protein